MSACRSNIAGPVLIVEDDPDIREILTESLAAFGFEVVTAAHGRDALTLLARMPVPPSVILLDLMMPVMDGWALLDALGHDDALAEIPVVVISAAKAGLRAPSQHAFLSKPLDYFKLVDTIDRSLRAPRVAS